MKTEDKRIGDTVVFWGITVIISAVCGFIMQMQLGLPEFEILKVYFIIGLLIYLFEILANTNGLPYFKEKKGIFGLLIGFLLTSGLICVGVYIPLYSLWMLGSAYIAKKIHPYVGIFYQLIFTFLICSIHGYGVEDFIYYFLIGSTVCILIRFADNVRTLTYVLIIVGSVEIIVSFLLSNFVFGHALTSSTLFMVLSGFAIILIVYFVKPSFETEGLNQMNPCNLEAVENGSNTKEESVSRDELAQFITSDAPLMRRLNEEKPYIYRHSLLIGILSEKAAHKIGANGRLARAGGLYHEVGKLIGMNYIEEGVSLATENGLPESIIAIIRQHNGKGEPPASKEAAIVLLTDNIIATIKYFEKQPKEKQRSNERIIEDIFKVRLEQGILDESGLSNEDYQILKDFYRTNLPKGGNE